MIAKRALSTGALMFSLFALLFATVMPAQAATTTTAWTYGKVTKWIDGDTVVTTRGTIRLIGVDTPALGACGGKASTTYANTLAPVGSIVRIGNPTSVMDKDRYGRYLRYVDVGTTVDIAYKQIVKGSKARYDSRDGYQWHPRQTKYRDTDAKFRNYSCGSTTTPTSSWATKANTPVSATNPDLDCADIPAAYKPVRITGTDYHRLDADGDGWGCES